MNHIQLTEDFRNTLLESANWQKIGFSLSETDEVLEDVVEEAKESKEEKKEEKVEEPVLEALSEEQEQVLGVIVEEAIKNDVFLHLFDKFAAVLDAADGVNESDEDFDQDDVLAKALCDVFPAHFTLEDEETKE